MSNHSPGSSESKIHLELGLTDEEFTSICELLGRQPNALELAMYAVMWSEHCSYKSSRRHLARLPTQAPWVLVGPGENAGVIDVGDDIAVAFRIESHNHPSAIEPYQGAATGVGGILRDIFTMGARPIAVMDSLRFGGFDDPRNRWLASGVVSGISGYGNSVGVPTVGGEFVESETFSHNPLVNVAAFGVLPKDQLVLGEASEPGAVSILMGAPTGRDGIGGVSVLASAGFSDAETDAAKLPSVQVGDPFEEKRLIEACLEMLEADLLQGLQDLGGAGLTCASSEPAARGGAGMEIDVAKVPRRQPHMQPFEVMTSESQERMLAIVSPSNVPQVMQICERWEIAAAAVGKVTGDGMLRVIDSSAPATSAPDTSAAVLAEIPAASLTEEAPNYDRPQHPPADLSARHSQDILNQIPTANYSQAVTPGLAAAASSLSEPNPVGGAVDAGASVTPRQRTLPRQLPDSPEEDLLALLKSKSWVYRQYDHQLFLNTVIGPGADATLLALRHPTTGQLTGRGLGVTTDGNHRWCYTDPFQGTAAVVAEALLNVACVGATPRALVNCLNFGNPTHPEVMWELSESIDGMAHACEAFGVPVVGGNVSLYNESAGTNIAPTPVVCMLGIHPDLQHPPPSVGLVEGDSIVLLGSPPSTDVPLGGTLWAWERCNLRTGALAKPNLDEIARTAALVADLVATAAVTAVHDISEGGLALALAEMACHSEVGCQTTAPLQNNNPQNHKNPIHETTNPSPSTAKTGTADVGAPAPAAETATTESSENQTSHWGSGCGSFACAATADAAPMAGSKTTESATPATGKALLIRALFAESHGRVLICTPPNQTAALLDRATAASVPAQVIGTAGGDSIRITPQVPASPTAQPLEQTFELPLAHALSAWHSHLPDKLEA